jgi:hypothetical protein
MTEAAFSQSLALNGYPLKPIPDWNAYNEITQTNFTVTFNVPSTPCKSCVIRARYLSNNLKEVDEGTTVFHNCADITIIAGKSTNKTKTTTKTMAAVTSNRTRIARGSGSDKMAAPQYSCCTPKQWFGAVTGKLGGVAFKSTIYYDAIGNRTRFDTVFGEVGSILLRSR